MVETRVYADSSQPLASLLFLFLPFPCSHSKSAPRTALPKHFPPLNPLQEVTKLLTSQKLIMKFFSHVCMYLYLGCWQHCQNTRKKTLKRHWYLLRRHFLFLFDSCCCCCCQLKVNVYSITHCSSDSNFNTDKMQKVVDFCFSCVSLTCSLLLLVPSSTGCSL